MSRLLARTTLRRETPALRAAFLAREFRLAADDQLLAEYEGRLPPPTRQPRPARERGTGPSPARRVFHPPRGPGRPMVSRLATDGALLQAALESGHAAALAAFRDEHDGACR